MTAASRWIDDRYWIVHGNFDYKSQTQDELMGLALFAGSPLLELGRC